MAERYLFSGSLPADAQNYVVRAADDELYQALLAGQFCYVLNSRQTGKSSLCIRTQGRLIAAQRTCITIDLSQKEVANANPESWYLELVETIAYELFLDQNLDIKQWWQSQHPSSPLNRFQQFINHQVLPNLEYPLVIFIDEIDSVLSLPFNTDDFFAYIRACHNRRALDDKYNTLTFCLLGVAAPNTLIKDAKRTPFNIGFAVKLKGFQLNETDPLQSGFDELNLSYVDSRQLLSEVLAWTGGQPFLTQKVCYLVHDALEQGNFTTVGAVVQESIIDNWAAKDTPEHLKTIQERLLADDEYKGIRLDLYRRIHHQGFIPYQGRDEEGSLMLSGVALEEDQRLRCGNQIYSTVFSEDWVEEQLQQFRPYHVVFSAWITSGEKQHEFLLRGGELKEAREWSEGKTLAPIDYRFINASQELAREEAISAEMEAKSALERIHQQELEAQKAKEQAESNLRKSNRRFRLSIGLLGLAVPLALASAIYAGERNLLAERLNKSIVDVETQLRVSRGELSDAKLKNLSQIKKNAQSNQRLQETRKHLKTAEINAKNAEKQRSRQQAEMLIQRKNIRKLKSNQSEIIYRSNLLVSNLLDNKKLLKATNKKREEVSTGINLEREANIILGDISARNESKLESLLLAINLGTKLQEIVEDGRPLHRFPAIQPIFLLNTIKDEIREKNLYFGPQGTFTNGLFSPDGHLILTSSQDATARLWNRKGERLQEFKGHQGMVTDLQFSPDGKSVLTTSDDKTARLWDLQSKNFHTLSGHQARVNGGRFSPDGQFILTASNDGTARLWSLNGQLIHTYVGHQLGVISAQFSPDGQFILTASNDGTARLWSLNGQLIHAYVGHQLGVISAQFSLDGQSILTTSRDKTARLWDRQGKLIHIYKGHQSIVESAQLSPDGQFVLTTSKDNTAQIWDRKGKLNQLLKGHKVRVISAQFSPDGQFILTTSQDQTARLWDRQGKLVHTYKGHQGVVKNAQFSPDSLSILTYSNDGTARLWDTKSDSTLILEGHKGKVEISTFNPDGQFILTASSDSTARLWTRQGQLIQVLKGHQLGINSAQFSPDGQFILTASNDSTARLWTRQGQLIQVLKGHQLGINSAQFSPDGQFILTASNDSTARLWTKQGRLIQVLKGHQLGINSAQFSPDGQFILTASNDSTARLWTRQGQLIQVLKGHQLGINSAQFSPDGQFILTASNDSTARLWTKQGRLIQVLKGHQDGGIKAQFSPDNQSILTFSKDNTAQLWNLEGRLLQVFKGHNYRITSANFSPNGQFILTSSVDSTARLWDRNGNILRVIEGHEGWIWNASFSPDSQSILTASNDGTARLWEFHSLPSLLSWGCTWINNYLANSPNAKSSHKDMCKRIQQKSTYWKKIEVQNR